jgi:hypothetical protein
MSLVEGDKGGSTRGDTSAGTAEGSQLAIADAKS